MRLKLLLFFIVLSVIGTAGFSYVVLNKAKGLANEEQNRLLLSFYKPAIEYIEKQLVSDAVISKVKLVELLPWKGSLYLSKGSLSSLYQSASSESIPASIIETISTQQAGNGYVVSENGSVYSWIDVLSEIADITIIHNDQSPPVSFWENLLIPFFIAAIAILWGSAWASQLIGNLLEKVEHQAESLDEKNHLLEDSMRQLEIARDQALAASETKSSFLANMSHELRTPLNAIIGYSELIYDEIEHDDGSLRQDMGKILNSGKHLLSLINDILDLSKIEAGKMDSYIEQVNVYKAIHDVIGSISPLVEKSGNTLMVNCSETIGNVETDITKLRQILFNLIGNANKFTQNGRVTLEVSRNGEGERENIVFSVKDTGIGMSNRQLARLFQAFAQADATTTREYGGTGLGLTISKHLSQILGGDISVTSEEGGGSTFTVMLPVKSPLVTSPGAKVDIGFKVDPREIRLGPEHSPLDPRRRDVACLLVIDDDANVRDLMERFLTRKGFYTYSAASADEGLILAQKLLPDLIFLDVMMPGKDGWQVLSELKEMDSVKEVPVVMLTLAGNKEMAMSLGAIEHVNKPMNWDELMRVILKYVRHDSLPLDRSD